jgi:hypothetical protein
MTEASTLAVLDAQRFGRAKVMLSRVVGCRPQTHFSSEKLMSYKFVLFVTAALAE